MLASPLLPAPPTFGPQPASDDYRPAKDIEAFNNLLPPPVEFVEGSSSGAYAVPEGKYKPINVPSSPKAPRHEKSPELTNGTPATPKPVSKPDAQPKTPKSPTKSLYPTGIDTSWPPNCNIGSGLHNTGNTCFLNSALQCLLHTPPLLRVLSHHKQESCKVDRGFCMACALRQVAAKSFSSRSPFAPSQITGRLQTIAKHMRKGRQEDTHEFLRYAIDALQKSCLAGYPPKIDQKLAETTWVHKIFGGRLRSRVTCRDCGYNSDTFDRILDLSLDILKSDTIKDALRKFVAIDYLKGADKYKCEKCKKPVTAEKRFTIHDAPLVLTVHLKRFSPLGRKIGHPVTYDDHLSLQPFMSEGSFGPTYSLYGVICHAGGGPHSGHYYAFVKSRDGKWWEMNDEMVSPINGPPLSKKSAYVLFYMRAKGQGLEGAVKSQINGVLKEQRSKPRLSESMKAPKPKDRDADDEDKGEKLDRPFIGPLLPSPSINGDSKKLNPVDPQAASLKSKIEKARSSMSTLEQYKSDDEDSDKEDFGEKVEDKGEETKGEPPSSPPKDVEMRPSSPHPPPPSSSPPHGASVTNGIPPTSFYGPTPPKKRKTPDNAHEGSSQKRQLLSSDFKKDRHRNPFNGITYKKRKPPRGL
ncbi:Usp36 protein [Coprinopsis cinerea okayama7|uniref:Ubiquitin carboxyl-terminal hydrolase n=1 Tax=Coprinopsis cinerea (strain Okayama-7 / 130 / ATCC MYA-4618 / FGSC 9003) TaxID=240176 RepID=A8NYI1_COPC7|nr:Usp36 protein [Coprinopsis cinerea okayama7\|eukprot:XP_001837434.1 Usp36 protein [Coprinopsis cinerea okayama7\